MEAKPTITIQKIESKKTITTKARRALKSHGLWKELTLFNDWALHAGERAKEGRADIIEFAELYLNVEVAAPRPASKKKKARPNKRQRKKKRTKC